MNKDRNTLQQEAVKVLQMLISLPSFSTDEWQTASELSKYLSLAGLEVTRVSNNVFALNKHYQPSLLTILLNSHHDTVKPNPQYTRDPFNPQIEGDRLFGLGSNDAGGSLVALMMAFLHFHDMPGLKYNLAFAATAEEEISGKNGIENALQYLPPINCAIVGEPTGMQLAVAERGLMVLDCEAIGVAGHAARSEGENALYKAMKDIDWIRTYSFPKTSSLLGPVKMSVTVIETDNKAHNVVPDRCRFIVDVRVNECYTLEEVHQAIQAHIYSRATPRSLRLRSSFIREDHPLVKAGIGLGRKTYGSPTTSDKALMPFPALKMGPGDSARSHTADEFIYISEIHEAIDIYIQLLNKLLL